MNPFINPFLINPNLSQKGINTINSVNPNEIKNNFNISHKRAEVINDTDLDNIRIEKDKKEKMNINENLSKSNDKKSKLDNNNNLNSESNDEEFKYNTYIYYNEKDKNKYLFTYYKISKSKAYIELRCKGRKECKGRAKFNLSNEIITIT